MHPIFLESLEWRKRIIKEAMAYKVKVYAFSNTGRETAKRIAEIKTKIFRGEKLFFEECIENKIDRISFRSASAHIFVGAIGIAVRKIAPYIEDKKIDPAIITVDEKGQFVIPVLSGHIGGANRLSELIAHEINATAVITTATDVNGYNAIDLLAADNRLSFIYSHNQNVNDKILKHELGKVFSDKDINDITDIICEKLNKEYENKISELPWDIVNEFEKAISLRVIDQNWMNHINDMEQLKEGVGLRGYANEDPLQAYIKEGYGIFDNMMDKISLETSQYLLKAEIRQNIERKEVAKPIINNREDGTLKGGTHKKEKIGRNDPCPCGSGKKYKQCCGK